MNSLGHRGVLLLSVFAFAVGASTQENGLADAPGISPATMERRHYAAVVRSAVSLRARGFPLSSVKLLDGPFRQAMETDKAYLLRLEPDRLLAGFRRANRSLRSSPPVRSTPITCSISTAATTCSSCRASNGWSNHPSPSRISSSARFSIISSLRRSPSAADSSISPPCDRVTTGPIRATPGISGAARTRAWRARPSTESLFTPARSTGSMWICSLPRSSTGRNRG